MNSKQIILIIVSVVLLGSVVLLTFMLSDGSSPLSLFNLRASNPQDEVDTFLSENNLVPTAPVAEVPEEGIETETEEDPELLAYNSTSPTVTPPTGSTAPTTSPSVTVSPSPGEGTPTLSVTPSADDATKGGLTATPTPTLTETPTPTPTEFIMVETSTTPVVVTELPVAGIGDNLMPILVGGGALILLAFLL